MSIKVLGVWSMTEYNIPQDLVCEEEYTVGKEDSAKIIGSGDVDVLSTPSMIAFMELTAWKCVQKYLPEDHVTVGTKVCVEHKAPTPIGERIKVIARIVKIEGRRITFEVKALWKDVVIGEGTHERYIIERKRFMEKVENMLKKQ